MKLFEPFLGSWEINTNWTNGNKLWSRNKYTVGIGGNFVNAVTYAKDGDGEPYQRYFTVFSYDKQKQQFQSYGFTYDGTVTIVDNKVSLVDGKTRIASQWDSGNGTIKQEVQMVSKDRYSWKVWMKPANSTGEDWQPLMDGVWKRVKE